MRLTGSKLVTDLLDADCALETAEFEFSLLRCKIRVLIFEFLGSNKGDLLRKNALNVIIEIRHMLLGQTNAFIDRLYRLFEELTGSLLLGDDLLPVPLIDIDGMDIIGILITADRIHVGV